MDRISRALEQARSKISKVHNESDAVPAKPIQYSSSRKISLEPDVLRENRVIIGLDDERIVDTYGLLRTRVLQVMKQNNWKTLGITSPNTSAGKSVTAINLSISIAQDHNHSVLLVDADLRKPGVCKTLGIEVEYGLNNYLLEESSLDDIFIHPEIKRLVMVPSNRVHGGASELLSSPRMIEFIEHSRQRYPERIVVFDLPPIMVGDDVVGLSQHLDALLLVVEDGKTQSNEFKQALELLKDVNIAGVVLNKSEVVHKPSEYY